MSTQEDTSPEQGSPPPDQTQPEHQESVDRGDIIAMGLRSSAIWAGRFVLIVIATAILLWLLAQVWVGVFPILLALILTTVLYPAASALMRRRWPPALASSLTLVGFLVVVSGVLAAIAPSIIDQSSEVVTRAEDGIDQLRDWVAGPPFNLSSERVDETIDQGVQAVTDWLQGNSGSIASGVLSGFSAVGSFTVTFVLTLVLTFFFLKDGARFLPWLRRSAGRSVGRHLTEVLTRVWRTLGGFIRTQAIVSAVDAVFIGLGLLLLGVPLAPALAVLTFFGGFIPIVGALLAGSLAVLVALVSNGWAIALAVLGVVLLVQQIEGNVLQPVLQSRTMEMHPGIILLAVSGGGTIFGIVGAFLAVPVAASVTVVLRYMSQQVDLRSGELHADEVEMITPEGHDTAVHGESRAPLVRELVMRKLEERREAKDASAETDDVVPDTAGSRPVTTRAGMPMAGRIRRRLASLRDARARRREQ